MAAAIRGEATPRMLKLLRNRWFQTAAFPLVGVVVGAVVSFLVFSNGDTEDTLLGNQLIFATGGSSAASTAGSGNVHLPVSAAAAVAAGWNDPVLCTAGRGRFFTQDRPGEDEPYILMFDKGDQIVGVYLYSKAEMPQPFERADELSGGTKLIDFEHWGLFVYTDDPTRACTKREEGSVDAAASGGAVSDSDRWQVTAARGTPTAVVPPTPTPAAGSALVDGAKQMAALKSLSFTLTAGEGGGPLMAGIDAEEVEGTVILPDQVTLSATKAGGEPQEVPADSLPFMFEDLAATLAGIIEALQDISDAPRKWIENVPTRGFSGNVTGEQLKGLIPSAIPDATAAVTIWIGEDGLVRRLEIKGPVAPDDGTEAVRELTLRGFDE